VAQRILAGDGELVDGSMVVCQAEAGAPDVTVAVCLDGQRRVMRCGALEVVASARWLLDAGARRDCP